MHAWPLTTSPVPPLLTDHEELAAAEAFNREMAELEDLEHQEELRSLLQDRISGESRLLVYDFSTVSKTETLTLI